MNPRPFAPLPAAPPRRPSLIVRAFTSPVTAAAVERRLRRSLRPAVRATLVAAPIVFALLLIGSGVAVWMQRPVALAPRHRAEALCFALAQRPRFAPPMGVEASSARVSQPFPVGTTPATALRIAMQFDDPQVSEEWQRHAGDYDLDVVWLRIPEHGVTRHWLVVGWMEDATLEVCSFRFAGTDPELSFDQKLWGQRLLLRVLLPEYFGAGSLPRVRLSLPRGETELRFGPRDDS
jgi:hypothetical protein